MKNIKKAQAGGNIPRTAEVKGNKRVIKTPYYKNTVKNDSILTTRRTLKGALQGLPKGGKTNLNEGFRKLGL